MVNTIGGKNYKKGKKGGRATKNPTKEFDTDNGIFFFAQVKSKLGGNTIEVLLQTGESVHATIPGRFLRKVWFNKDDLIVVSNETANYYDVVQKITNPATQAEAMAALNIKLDKDNSQLFRTDIDDIEDEDDEPVTDHKEASKAELNALRKKKDKERDLQRRGGDEDREISVVTKKSSDEDSEDDEDNEDGKSSKKSSTKSGSTKSGSTKSTQSAQSTQSTQSTQSAQSTDSDEESDVELFTPVVVTKKKTVQPEVTQTKVTADKFKKKDEQPKPTTPKKVIHHTETPEEIAKMMGF
jgi:translation initiation factor IF-1